MTQTKQTSDITTIDQRLFHLFDSFRYNDDSFSGSLAFATATPTTTLHLFKILKEQVSRQEFNLHQPTYVRGMTIAINRNKWPQENAQDLVDIANWFIARSYPSARRGGPRRDQIKNLTAIIQSKVDVPQEQKDAWKTLFAPARVTAPKDVGLVPTETFSTPFENIAKARRNFSDYDR